MLGVVKPPPLPIPLANPRCPYCGRECWVDIPPGVPAAALMVYPLAQCPTCPTGQARDEMRYGLNYTRLRLLALLVEDAAAFAFTRCPGGGFAAAAATCDGETHVVRWN